MSNFPAGSGYFLVRVLTSSAVLSGLGCLWSVSATAAPAPTPDPGKDKHSAPFVKVWDHDRGHGRWHHRGFGPDPWFDGFWREGWFGGRYGWWWSVGGRRYWYDRPIYPYPPMESEIIIVDQPPPVIVQQPPVIVQQPPVVVEQQPQPSVQAQPPQPVPPPPPAETQSPSAPPAVQPQPNMWYYCDNPAGYYPYVKSCTTPFRAVPAH